MLKLVLTVSIIFLLNSVELEAQQAYRPIQALLDSIEIVLADEKIPGAMISIVTGDSIIYSGGVGHAVLEDSVAVTDKHLFRLGSISKTMTSLAIMRLVEQGKLSLKTPVLEIDPSLPIKNKWRETSPILVEHLLEHTAGFDDMHFYAMYNTTDASRPTCREMIDTHSKSLTARWEPGTYMSYANPGYVIAGHVIEHVSGMAFDDFIKQEILDPIGMVSSGFYFKEPTSFPMAVGYENEGGKYTAIDYPSIQGGPAGELCSNAEDMAQFLQFMLNRQVSNAGRQLLSESTFERMESSHTTMAAKMGLPGGYGLAIGSGWKHGYKTLGHNGGIDGFVSDYFYLPDADFAVAVSVNTSRRTGTIVNAIVDYYVEAPELERTVVPISVDLKEKYEGFYSYLNPRNQLFGFLEHMITGVSLTVEGDSILIKEIMGHHIDTWYHAGGQQFYTKQEGEPFAMLLEIDGKEAIWVDGGYAEKESEILRWIKNILFALSILSTIIYFMYGFFAQLIRLLTKNKRLGIGRISLWLGSMSFAIMAISFIGTMESIQDVAKPHAFSIAVCLSSILFLLFSVLGAVYSFKQNDGGLFSTWYFRITALLMLGLALFLLIHGFIGIRLWNY